jgi:hypothetical protein
MLLDAQGFALGTMVKVGPDHNDHDTGQELGAAGVYTFLQGRSAKGSAQEPPCAATSIASIVDQGSTLAVHIVLGVSHTEMPAKDSCAVPLHARHVFDMALSWLRWGFAGRCCNQRQQQQQLPSGLQ